MVRHGRTIIRITVSAKKVCLSRPLIKALKNPSHIVFYRGVGENEGKVIIAATREDDDTEKILITPDRKNVYFWKSDFVSMCVKMVQKYAGGTFKRGTFYSVAGLPFDDEGFDAFVFDFREAAEHIVKNTGYNGRKQAAHPAFNMPRGYQAMMKKAHLRQADQPRLRYTALMFFMPVGCPSGWSAGSFFTKK